MITRSLNHKYPKTPILESGAMCNMQHAPSGRKTLLLSVTDLSECCRSVHPSSPEQYFLLEQRADVDEAAILQPSHSLEQAENSRPAGGSACAEEQGDVSVEADTKQVLDDEAGTGLVKEEAESGADSQHSGRQAEVLEAVLPSEAAVKAEHTKAAVAAESNGQMLTSDTGGHPAAGHAELEGTPPRSSAAPTAAENALLNVDRVSQASEAHVGELSGRQPGADVTGTSGQADTEHPMPSAAKESGAEAACQMQQQRNLQETAAVHQPRLANGRFLPRKRRRPDGAPADGEAASADPAGAALSPAQPNSTASQSSERPCSMEVGPAALPEAEPQSGDCPAPGASQEGGAPAQDGASLLGCAHKSSFMESCIYTGLLHTVKGRVGSLSKSCRGNNCESSF